eukprot:1343589-Amorphochlora_amoeboformis.AAC.1
MRIRTQNILELPEHAQKSSGKFRKRFMAQRHALSPNIRKPRCYLSTGVLLDELISNNLRNLQATSVVFGRRDVSTGY